MASQPVFRMPVAALNDPFLLSLPILLWERDAITHQFIALTDPRHSIPDAETWIGRTSAEIFGPEFGRKFDALDDRAALGPVDGIITFGDRAWLYSLRRDGDVVRGTAAPLDAFNVYV